MARSPTAWTASSTVVLALPATQCASWGGGGDHSISVLWSTRAGGELHMNVDQSSPRAALSTSKGSVTT